MGRNDLHLRDPQHGWSSPYNATVPVVVYWALAALGFWLTISSVETPSQKGSAILCSLIWVVILTVLIQWLATHGHTLLAWIIVFIGPILAVIIILLALGVAIGVSLADAMYGKSCKAPNL